MSNPNNLQTIQIIIIVNIKIKHFFENNFNSNCFSEELFLLDEWSKIEDISSWKEIRKINKIKNINNEM